jgi:uncharacterized protein (DUF885 family)
LFGFYSQNLRRAALLVVDSGLHAFGWSRQKSIDFLMNNTAMDWIACELEVDKSLAAPGMIVQRIDDEIQVNKVQNVDCI